jgi:hypothetical protein
MEGTVRASEGAITANFCLEEEEEMLNIIWTTMENRHLEERLRNGIVSLRWMLAK